MLHPAMGLQRIGLHAEHPIRVETMSDDEFDDDQRVDRAIGLLVEPGRSSRAMGASRPARSGSKEWPD